MRFFVLLFALLLTSATADAQRTTLLDRNGERMRGTPLALGRNNALGDTRAAVSDPAWWAQLDSLELNTVRLCYVDPWYDTRPFGPTWTTEEALPFIDAAVANAVANDLNIIINYHNVGGYQEHGNFGRVQEFWEAVAPRYADNDLVYYELDNEPTFNGSDYLREDFMDTLRTVYERVHELAPDRHIILFSFNSTTYSSKNIVDAYDWVDFDYTTVGWHFYGWFEGSIIAQQNNLIDLINAYPTICTEWDVDISHDYTRPFFGNNVMAQNLEQFGISWVDWRNWADASLDIVRDSIIPDAMAQGYWWGDVSSVDNGRAVLPLTLQPNPAGDQVTVSGLVDLTGQTADLVLYDMTGRVVFRQRQPAAATEVRVDLHDVPAGLYVLRVSGNGMTGVGKLRVR